MSDKIKTPDKSKKSETPIDPPWVEDPMEEILLPKVLNSDAELEQKMLEKVTAEKEKIVTNMPKNNKDVVRALYQNEDGDAYLLTDIFYGKYLYDHAARRWYYWNDHYWREDKLNHAPILIQEIIKLYGSQSLYEKFKAQELEKAGDTDKAKNHKTRALALTKRIEQLQTLKRKRSILSLAVCGKNSLGDTGEDWDTQAMLLGCKNGTLDLETGEHYPGNPEDHIKTIAPINWEGIDAPCPTWEKFLLDIMGQDQEVVDYLQRLFGYGVTGLTTEHIYPIFWGKKGRNGKSTMLETLKYVLGSMAYKAPTRFFMQQSQSKGVGAPDAELMAFRGARLVWGAETNDGDRLDAARLKELVGGDTISARPPYGKRQIEFKPTHLLLLLTNKLPKVPANDKALWRRIHLIQFKHSFLLNPDPNNRYELPVDKDLPDKLQKEAPGILAWLVQGCLAWQKSGLLPPKSVNDATKDYQVDEDVLGHFITECCALGDAEKAIYRVNTKVFYERYKEWCADAGHHPMARKRFLDDMKERFKTVKNNTIYFVGVALINAC
ncbi:MAG: hypothetical protein GY710_26275 [Desulfobacteraceae bacterium]|nr:hypothetical protein [Desulfobacteraceae bacterium]